jgi:hypothetical protein
MILIKKIDYARNGILALVVALHFKFFIIDSCYFIKFIYNMIDFYT